MHDKKMLSSATVSLPLTPIRKLRCTPAACSLHSFIHRSFSHLTHQYHFSRTSEYSAHSLHSFAVCTGFTGVRKYPIRRMSQPTINATEQATASTESATSVTPGVIVGAGRVGQALVRIGPGSDILIKRNEKVPENSSGPIYVCTRNDALDTILEATPRERWDDLVFLQNGMLEPWLESKGLAHATQLLVYFAVAKLGDNPVDGKTDMNPEGLSAVTGKWGEAVAARLHAAGLSCKVLPPKEFKKPMLEKLIWISAFMLVGARHPGATIGDVEQKYKEEVLSLIKELSLVAETQKGIKFDNGLEERLCAYARSVSHFPTAIKEFQWRNGWFYDLSNEAITSGKADSSPLHTAWLKEVGAIDA